LKTVTVLFDDSTNVNAYSNPGIIIISGDGFFAQIGTCDPGVSTTSTSTSTTTSTSTSTTTTAAPITTTTTIASTTTISPCIYYVSDGVVEDDGHCGENYITGTQLFSDPENQFGCSVSSLQDKILYTNAQLTNSFDGGGLYYFISTQSGASSTTLLAENGQYQVVLINTSGVVTQIIDQDCDGQGGPPE
jgi:hypothetical protein